MLEKLTTEQLIEALRAEGLTPRSYSGRGMYGAQCVGANVRHIGDHVLPRGWQDDGMGMGRIVYWPDVAWPESMNHAR